MDSKQQRESTHDVSRAAGRALRKAIFITALVAVPTLAFYACGTFKLNGYQITSSSGTLNLNEANGNKAPASQIEPSDQHTNLGVPTDALWIDARSSPEYVREHVPGALNLNEVNWNEALAKLIQIWRPPRPIIVYCSFRCSSGVKIAAKLKDHGFEPVQVLDGGFERWKQSSEQPHL